MFALRNGPPDEVQLRGAEYRLVKVFKHDFWAATCLYEDKRKPGGGRIVVKFGRMQAFCGLPLAFYSKWLADHEERIYRLLAGIKGVPECLGQTNEGGLAIEYVEAVPLDHLDVIPTGLFDRLREIMEQIHQRGVAYCDANKKSNVLVSPDGECFLIDYQIAICAHDNWPWPLRRIFRAAVKYMADKDIYHILKHKRRLAPEQLLPGEEAASRSRGPFHRIHRKLGKPYRFLRRRFLQGQYAKGALRSPTEAIEDHYQPEKDTWRKDDNRAKRTKGRTK